ncbi:MAG: hypothetical protein WDW38_007640 [Sanguina aurantia]
MRDSGKNKLTRGYRVWCASEEDELRAGVLKCGLGAWEVIRRDPEFPGLSDRSGVQLKDKWRNLVKFRHIGAEEQKTYKPKNSGPWSKKYSEASFGVTSVRPPRVRPRHRSRGTSKRTGGGSSTDTDLSGSTDDDDADDEHAAALLALEGGSVSDGGGRQQQQQQRHSQRAAVQNRRSFADVEAGRNDSREGTMERERCRGGDSEGDHDHGPASGNHHHHNNSRNNNDNNNNNNNSSHSHHRSYDQQHDQQAVGRKRQRLAEDRRFGEWPGAPIPAAGVVDLRPAPLQREEAGGGSRGGHAPGGFGRRPGGAAGRAAARRGGGAEYVVACGCGMTYDDGAAMIECERCKVWAHIDCLKSQMASQPAKYFYDLEEYLCHSCAKSVAVTDAQAALHGRQYAASARAARSTSPTPTHANAAAARMEQIMRGYSSNSIVLDGSARRRRPPPTAVMAAPVLPEFPRLEDTRKWTAFDSAILPQQRATPSWRGSEPEPNGRGGGGSEHAHHAHHRIRPSGSREDNAAASAADSPRGSFAAGAALPSFLRGDSSAAADLLAAAVGGGGGVDPHMELSDILLGLSAAPLSRPPSGMGSGLLAWPQRSGSGGLRGLGGPAGGGTSGAAAAAAPAGGGGGGGGAARATLTRGRQSDLALEVMLGALEGWEAGAVASPYTNSGGLSMMEDGGGFPGRELAAAAGCHLRASSPRISRRKPPPPGHCATNSLNYSGGSQGAASGSGLGGSGLPLFQSGAPARPAQSQVGRASRQRVRTVRTERVHPCPVPDMEVQPSRSAPLGVSRRRRGLALPRDAGVCRGDASWPALASCSHSSCPVSPARPRRSSCSDEGGPTDGGNAPAGCGGVAAVVQGARPAGPAPPCSPPSTSSSSPAAAEAAATTAGSPAPPCSRPPSASEWHHPIHGSGTRPASASLPAGLQRSHSAGGRQHRPPSPHIDLLLSASQHIPPTPSAAAAAGSNAPPRQALAAPKAVRHPAMARHGSQAGLQRLLDAAHDSSLLEPPTLLLQQQQQQHAMMLDGTCPLPRCPSPAPGPDGNHGGAGNSNSNGGGISTHLNATLCPPPSQHSAPARSVSQPSLHRLAGPGLRQPPMFQLPHPAAASPPTHPGPAPTAPPQSLPCSTPSADSQAPPNSSSGSSNQHPSGCKSEPPGEGGTLGHKPVPVSKPLPACLPHAAEQPPSGVLPTQQLQHSSTTTSSTSSSSSRRRSTAPSGPTLSLQPPWTTSCSGALSMPKGGGFHPFGDGPSRAGAAHHADAQPHPTSQQQQQQQQSQQQSQPQSQGGTDMGDADAEPEASANLATPGVLQQARDTAQRGEEGAGKPIPRRASVSGRRAPQPIQEPRQQQQPSGAGPGVCSTARGGVDGAVSPPPPGGTAPTAAGRAPAGLSVADLDPAGGLTDPLPGIEPCRMHIPFHPPDSLLASLLAQQHQQQTSRGGDRGGVFQAKPRGRVWGQSPFQSSEQWPGAEMLARMATMQQRQEQEREAVMQQQEEEALMQQQQQQQRARAAMVANPPPTAGQLEAFPSRFPAETLHMDDWANNTQHPQTGPPHNEQQQQQPSVAQPSSPFQAGGSTPSNLHSPHPWKPLEQQHALLLQQSHQQLQQQQFGLQQLQQLQLQQRQQQQTASLLHMIGQSSGSEELRHHHPLANGFLLPPQQQQQQQLQLRNAQHRRAHPTLEARVCRGVCAAAVVEQWACVLVSSAAARAHLLPMSAHAHTGLTIAHPSCLSPPLQLDRCSRPGSISALEHNPAADPGAATHTPPTAAAAAAAMRELLGSNSGMHAFLMQQQQQQQQHLMHQQQQQQQLLQLSSGGKGSVVSSNGGGGGGGGGSSLQVAGGEACTGVGSNGGGTSSAQCSGGLQQGGGVGGGGGGSLGMNMNLSILGLRPMTPDPWGMMFRSSTPNPDMLLHGYGHSGLLGGGSAADLAALAWLKSGTPPLGDGLLTQSLVGLGMGGLCLPALPGGPMPAALLGTHPLTGLGLGLGLAMDCRPGSALGSGGLGSAGSNRQAGGGAPGGGRVLQPGGVCAQLAGGPALGGAQVMGGGVSHTDGCSPGAQRGARRARSLSLSRGIVGVSGVAHHMCKPRWCGHDAQPVAQGPSAAQ